VFLHWYYTNSNPITHYNDTGMKLHSHHLNIRSGNFSIEKQHYENLNLNERLASMFAGGFLIRSGLTRPWKPTFLYGVYMTYRGVTGHCLFYEKLGINSNKPHAINIRGEFVVDRPPGEVYAYWRNLNNLSGSIMHLLDVEILDEHLSRWKSNILGNMLPVDWEAKIIKDEPGRLIGWRSAPGTIIGHVGRVQFAPAEDGAGTVLKIVLSYQPPGGGLGIGLAKVLNPYFEHLLKKEIKNFKHTIEQRAVV